MGELLGPPRWSITSPKLVQVGLPGASGSFRPASGSFAELLGPPRWSSTSTKPVQVELPGASESFRAASGSFAELLGPPRWSNASTKSLRSWICCAAFPCPLIFWVVSSSLLLKCGAICWVGEMGSLVGSSVVVLGRCGAVESRTDWPTCSGSARLGARRGKQSAQQNAYDRWLYFLVPSPRQGRRGPFCRTHAVDRGVI